MVLDCLIVELSRRSEVDLVVDMISEIPDL